MSANSKKRANMAEIPENSLAAAAEIVATLSNLSEKQCSSSKEEEDIKSILNILNSGNKNPAELRKMLTLLAGIESLCSPVRARLDGLMQKLEKLCAAEEKVRISPGDATLIDNANKIKACVNTKLTELQSDNSQKLTANRINHNHWTNAEKNVDTFTKAIFQGVL